MILRTIDEDNIATNIWAKSKITDWVSQSVISGLARSLDKLKHSYLPKTISMAAKLGKMIT